MSENEPSNFSKKIDAQARRKIEVQKNPSQGVWFGLGMMGLIGWSVVVPTLLGAALGMWIDQAHKSMHSWTLILLLVGLLLGCFNAWHWVAKEDEAMRKHSERRDE